MPIYFSQSSQDFLTQFHFLPLQRGVVSSRSNSGGGDAIPINKDCNGHSGSSPACAAPRCAVDSFSLTEVLVHINTVCTLFHCLLEFALQRRRQRDASSSAALGADGGAAQALYGRVADLQKDFLGGLNGCVLRPLLLDVLSQCVDARAFDLPSVRRDVEVLLSTPYIAERAEAGSSGDDSDEDREGERGGGGRGRRGGGISDVRSHTAVLLVQLARAVHRVRCWAQSAGLPAVPLPPAPPVQDLQREAVLFRRPFYVSAARDRGGGAKADDDDSDGDGDGLVLGLPRGVAGGQRAQPQPRRRRRTPAQLFDPFLPEPQPPRRRRAAPIREANQKVKEEETEGAASESWGCFAMLRQPQQCSRLLVCVPEAVQWEMLSFLPPRHLPVALSVCCAWWVAGQLPHGPLRGARLLSRAVTDAYVGFFQEEWGERMVLVPQLTVAHWVAVGTDAGGGGCGGLAQLWRRLRDSGPQDALWKEAVRRVVHTDERFFFFVSAQHRSRGDGCGDRRAAGAREGEEEAFLLEHLVDYVLGSADTDCALCTPHRAPLLRLLAQLHRCLAPTRIFADGDDGGEQLRSVALSLLRRWWLLEQRGGGGESEGSRGAVSGDLISPLWERWMAIEPVFEFHMERMERMEGTPSV